jgi:hypothetical protein
MLIDSKMRNSISTDNANAVNNQRINAFVNLSGAAVDLGKNKPVNDILAAEGCENFVNYLDLLGLAGDPNLIVLSSLHHYYYDADEMKNIQTIINQKELNQIRDLKSFLHSIFHILPNKSSFVGCFIDNEKLSGFSLRNTNRAYHTQRDSDAIENGIASRIPFLNMIYNMMDSKTNKYMSRTNVTSLLASHGFKILDMTELNGLTYFCAQKIQTLEN